MHIGAPVVMSPSSSPLPEAAAAAAPAVVAPAVAGTPVAPTVLWTEGFGTSTGTTTTLTAYNSAYTASAYFLDVANCNSTVLANNDTSGWDSACKGGPISGLKSLAVALATLNGSNTGTDRVVAAYTRDATLACYAGHPGGTNGCYTTINPTASTTTYAQLDAEMTQFKATNLSVPAAANKFVILSVDAAATACNYNGNPSDTSPKFQWYFLDNGTTPVDLTNVPNDVCKNGTGTMPLKSGHFASDKSAKSSSGTVGLQLINLEPSSDGNDAAYDNIKLLDATPQLDKSFSPTTVAAGGTSTMTFTVTNTTDKVGVPPKSWRACFTRLSG